MRRLFLPLFVLAILTLLLHSGCATVFGGRSNRLTVEEGTPPSAEVWLDGQIIGTTPLKTKLDKNLIQDGSILEIKKEGYKTDSVILERKIHPWYMLADVVTGGIWVGLDLGSGNLYRPANNKLSYELQQAN